MGTVVALLLLGLAFADDVSPAQEARAIELYDNGRELFAEGAYADAVVAWEASWQLSRKPLLLYNLASAYERLGDIDMALLRLNNYRAFAPAEEREELDRRIRNLERRMAEEDARRAAELSAQRPEPVPVAVPVPVPVPVPEPAPARAPVPAITALSIGGLGLASVAVFGTQARSARVELADACPGGVCPGEASDLLSRDRTLSALTDVSLGVAIIGVGAGVGLLVAGRRSARTRIGPGGIRGSF